MQYLKIFDSSFDTFDAESNVTITGIANNTKLNN